MAPMALGRIDIKYRRVACQVPQNLNVIVDQNRGAGGWIRLQVKVGASFGSAGITLHASCRVLCHTSDVSQPALRLASGRRG